VISLPPLSQSVASGHDASFTVIAVALGYLEYQWLHGGKPIPDATNATLTLHKVQLSDAGPYVARIIKGSRLVDSAPATLIVDGLDQGRRRRRNFVSRRFYESGDVAGSRYAAPASGLPVLDLPNALVTLDGGNLTVPLQVDVVMDAYNRIAVAPPNGMRLS